MKTVLTISRSFGTSDVLSRMSRYLNPFRLLRAQEQRYNFRKLDPSALRDMGISQRDADNASLGDFLNSHSR